MHWKVPGQTSVFIENLLSLIIAEKGAVPVVNQHQSHLLGVLEHPDQRFSMGEPGPVHRPHFTEEGLDGLGQGREQKGSAVIQVRQK